MMYDADFAAQLASRLGTRWRRAPEVPGLGDHLRRDIGLPPERMPLSRMLRREGW